MGSTDPSMCPKPTRTSMPEASEGRGEIDRRGRRAAKLAKWKSSSPHMQPFPRIIAPPTASLRSQSH